ncbi:MAG: UvrD-helicase domain-containing protein [Nitrospirae bacterium]|nr:UvrD-helicase domain-containing protein [Nitrospirota bacterium]
MSKYILTQGLDQKQKEAILYSDGPLLILAGTGSGKTKIITHKFSYLVKAKGFKPDSILTFTFTNKAADEMRKKISCMINNDIYNCWIGTFQSHCNRILRKEIKELGINNTYSIYDEDDQHCLIRHILKEFKIHEALYKGIASRISSLKSFLVGPDEFLTSGDGFGFDEKLAKVYIRYQDELIRSNALDHDDLIMLTVRLFERNKKLLEKYCNMFSYILVDDFQELNYAQYTLLKLFLSYHVRVCVIGDDDLCIFRYKSPEPNTIMCFERDFPGVKLIKLEQNHRSSRNILAVSDAVISKNSERKNKKLWTNKDNDEKVVFCYFNTHEEEAKYIAKVIKELYLKGRYDYRDFAVLYRINLQSKVLEDSLRNEGLPYRVLGNSSFYHKKEIKDIISYLRLAINHKDNVSLRRAIKSPSMGISASILSKIEHEAKKKSISLYDFIKASTRSDKFPPSVKEKLLEFIKLIESISALRERHASDILKTIFKKSGYSKTFDEEKIKNVEELILLAGNRDVKDFLDRVSLSTNMDEIEKGDYISLMTLHSAKGLEFPVVFIIGLEEGVLPYCKAIEDQEEIAEERKLFYLGITRAKDILWLTCASKRKLYTKLQEQEPSRFLKDVPKNCCQWLEKKLPQWTSRHEPLKERTMTKHIYAVYTTGCRVKHPVWGIGVIRDCYGDGDKQKVTVNFSSFGVKRLLVKFANLEKL